MSLGWDDEAPSGFQDADLELAEFEAQALEAEFEYGLEEADDDFGDDLGEVEEREPYMTAAELRFEADLDAEAAWEAAMFGDNEMDW